MDQVNLTEIGSDSNGGFVVSHMIMHQHIYWRSALDALRGFRFSPDLVQTHRLMNLFKRHQMGNKTLCHDLATRTSSKVI